MFSLFYNFAFVLMLLSSGAVEVISLIKFHDSIESQIIAIDKYRNVKEFGTS